LRTIPSYRLPQEIVDKEIEGILKQGIDIETNKELGKDFSLQELKQQFDAICIATGLKERKLNIEGVKLSNSFLRLFLKKKADGNGEFFIDVDGVVIAVGEEGKTVDGEMEDTFLCGDILTQKGTVSHAIGSGKETASLIHEYFFGESTLAVLPVVKPEDINLDYFKVDYPPEEKKRDVSQRIKDFDEVCQGLTKEEVIKEAKRCFGCGKCNGCDNCYVFCPDAAISKQDGKYIIDYDHCKGCGICVEECPRGVVSMRRTEK